jgi:hypothetical protein
MTAPAGSHIALRHARLLLVKAGLSEEEADRFLRRISEEVVSGKLESQETRLEFIENQLAQIKSPGVATTAITAVATGLFANALYDIIKAGVQGVKPEAPPAPPDEVDIIQIEWAEIRLPKKSYELEGALRSALKTREQKHGTFDKRVAVYLDAIAMCLDAKRNHRGAVQLRRQALKISQRVTGATSESTAAALCNLGLSLRIPMHRGHLLRFDRGQATDLIAATIPI